MTKSFKRPGRYQPVDDWQARRKAAKAAFANLPEDESTEIGEMAEQLQTALSGAGIVTALEILAAVGQLANRINPNPKNGGTE